MPHRKIGIKAYLPGYVFKFFDKITIFLMY